MLKLKRNHAITVKKPMSPMQLYKIACNAAVFASVRCYHHPISRKDIISTSHSINGWKRLVVVTRISIVMRNINRYLKISWYMGLSVYILFKIL